MYLKSKIFVNIHTNTSRGPQASNGQLPGRIIVVVVCCALAACAFDETRISL